MSQNEDFVLPDGRKISDLKVADLKKELDKFGKRKSGTKSELITRLIEAVSASTKSLDVNDGEPQVDSNNLNTKATECKTNDDSVPDLDDSDDARPEASEINQSVDTIELGAPIDDSLNSVDDITQEDQIQINLSKDEEADMNLEEKECSNPIEDEERVDDCISQDKGDVKENAVENEAEIVLNMEMDTTLEMYEGDNMELDIEDKESKKEAVEVTVRDTEVRKVSEDCENVEETEEGEVVPITARLGKRKVVEDNDGDMSPKKTKKKGLKETKGAGHIVEEPQRMKSPQKSRNIISDILRVDNLVRPFTMTQLQDVLSLKGHVLGLWLNKIKSVAYVKYESESAAINARESLDGCKWPSINPKLLVADFATRKEMEWMKENGDSGVNPPSYLRQAEGTKQTNDSQALPGWKDVDATKERRPRERLDHEDVSKRRRSRSKDRVRVDGVKEGHKEGHRSTHRDKGREERSKDKGKAAPAAKLLEDLFRKTSTQPAIYWLPVTRDKEEGGNVAAKKVGADMLALAFSNHC